MVTGLNTVAGYPLLTCIHQGLETQESTVSKRQPGNETFTHMQLLHTGMGEEAFEGCVTGQALQPPVYSSWFRKTHCNPSRQT